MKMPMDQPIVEKLRRHGADVHSEFRESDEFQRLMEDCLTKIASAKQDVFVHLHEFLNELKRHRVGRSKKSEVLEKWLMVMIFLI